MKLDHTLAVHANNFITRVIDTVYRSTLAEVEPPAKKTAKSSRKSALTAKLTQHGDVYTLTISDGRVWTQAHRKAVLLNRARHAGIEVDE